MRNWELRPTRPDSECLAGLLLACRTAKPGWARVWSSRKAGWACRSCQDYPRSITVTERRVGIAVRYQVPTSCRRSGLKAALGVPKSTDIAARDRVDALDWQPPGGERRIRSCDSSRSNERPASPHCTCRVGSSIPNWRPMSSRSAPLRDGPQLSRTDRGRLLGDSSPTRPVPQPRRHRLASQRKRSSRRRGSRRPGNRCHLEATGGILYQTHDVDPT